MRRAKKRRRMEKSRPERNHEYLQLDCIWSKRCGFLPGYGIWVHGDDWPNIAASSKIITYGCLNVDCFFVTSDLILDAKVDLM